MAKMISDPFHEMNISALYKKLGDAWIAQFVPQPGRGYILESSEAIGKNEYDAFAAKRREAVELPLRHGQLDHMHRQIKMSATWSMPTPIVLAIAVKRRLYTQNAHITERLLDPPLA